MTGGGVEELLNTYKDDRLKEREVSWKATA